MAATCVDNRALPLVVDDRVINPIAVGEVRMATARNGWTVRVTRGNNDGKCMVSFHRGNSGPLVTSIHLAPTAMECNDDAVALIHGFAQFLEPDGRLKCPYMKQLEPFMDNGFVGCI